VLEPALDAIDREGSELFPFGNKFMKAILCNLAAVGCLLALIDLPSEFYKVLRFVVGAACIAVILEIQKSESAEKVKTWTSIGFGMLAVIYNPILPLSLEREEWFWINCVGAVALLTTQHQKKIATILQQIKGHQIDGSAKRQQTKFSKTEITIFSLLGISFITLPSIFFLKDDRSGIALGFFLTFMVAGFGAYLVSGVDDLFNGDKYKRESTFEKEFNDTISKAKNTTNQGEREEIIRKFLYSSRSSKSQKTADRPANLQLPVRSTQQMGPAVCLDNDCPAPTEEQLLKMNIKGLSEMLLECLRERAGLILNAVNRKAVDSNAAAKASRELLRLSNRISSVLNKAIGNFDTDESDEEIRSARSTEELAAQAYMRFFTAAVVLKIHSTDDLADEIDRQIEEITGEKKTKLG